VRSAATRGEDVEAWSAAAFRASIAWRSPGCALIARCGAASSTERPRASIAVPTSRWSAIRSDAGRLS
jgi:hypothetical protein